MTVEDPVDVVLIDDCFRISGELFGDRAVEDREREVIDELEDVEIEGLHVCIMGGKEFPTAMVGLD